MKRYLFTALLFLNLLSLSVPLMAENIQYVSDRLSIPMRSGITTGHKILKFIKSGVALDVMEFSEDKKYARVEFLNDRSKTGWIETKFLMPKKSARAEIKAIKQNNQAVHEKYNALKSQLSTAKEKNKALSEAKLQLEGDIGNLQRTLTDLRDSSANPIRISRENAMLKKQLDEAEAKASALAQENSVLEGQSEKQWFMVGAGISIGSLLLGILLTRIRWTKRESWGGNSF